MRSVNRATSALALAASLLSVVVLSACQPESEFTFGGSKRDVLTTLREVGVQTLALDVHPRIHVTSARDFANLQDVEGVIVGAGGLRAGFREDSIEFLQIAPVHEAWRKHFDGVTSRAEVLAGLEGLYVEEPSLSIRSIAIRNTYVKVEELSDQDYQLLERYDEWTGSYTDSRGYWHLTLNFEDGRLTEVRRGWFPGPL